MKMTRTVLAGLLLSLAACGGQADETQAAAEAPAKKERPDVPVSLKERDPEAYRGNVGSVMSQVPPEKQEDFKKLMACKVKQAAAAGRPVVVDTAFSAQLLLKLNTDPDALLGCE
jgi:hypothetical protein